MKRNRIICGILLLTALAVLPGCRTEGAWKPINTNKYNYESNEPFVLMDRSVQRSVTVTGLQETILEDGRLEVKANVRNRVNRRIQVQISCVFKNENGFSTGDETPWKTLILTEAEQQTVPFVSANAQAKKYTIRVRQAR
ncbi:MAG: hypothetical protein M2R45_02281 [Verrucomicrobia subdivision 3 bacterium]|nr:hypothetical protein [Limisphaerales bacterium]MCS1414660.1 hypothetical protein [Limisphaerales bacterium]